VRRHGHPGNEDEEPRLDACHARFPVRRSAGALPRENRRIPGRNGTPVNYDRFYRFIAEGWAERTACVDVIPRIFDRVRSVTDPVPWADDATIVLIGFRDEPPGLASTPHLQATHGR